MLGRHKIYDEFAFYLRLIDIFQSIRQNRSTCGQAVAITAKVLDKPQADAGNWLKPGNGQGPLLQSNQRAPLKQMRNEKVFHEHPDAEC
jgi:hypothetical protein